jgi:hypothetical protein
MDAPRGVLPQAILWTSRRAARFSPVRPCHGGGGTAGAINISQEAAGGASASASGTGTGLPDTEAHAGTAAVTLHAEPPVCALRQAPQVITSAQGSRAHPAKLPPTGTTEAQRLHREAYLEKRP